MLALSECSLRPKGLLDWLERSFASLRACPEQREGVTPIRISQLVNGQRAITVDTVMQLARYFGTSAAVWLRW